MSSAATTHTITGARPLRGRLRLPGCKGLSHRALLFAALADGRSRIESLAPGADVASTRRVLHHLGVAIRRRGPDTVTVAGRGVAALREPVTVLDCGNSGTTMRMTAGLLAGRPFLAVLSGDASLSRRPMRRVAEPLRALGAFVDGRDGGNRPPLVVRGGALTGRRIELAVPSGQVHSALVLAGLQAEGTTEIVEPAPSRDHTARLLGALGAPVEVVDTTTLRVRAGAPVPFEFAVPGDPSSAAFFVVAAAITPGSEIELVDVSLNPGRIAYLDVLRAMGADIEVRPVDERLGEPVGTLTVRSAALAGTTIRSSEAIVDELPLLALAAAFATGTTEIVDAAELRVKESDRIATIEAELCRMGARVEALEDGLVVHGDRAALRPAAFESHGDHRIAMAGAVAANALPGRSTVHGWGSVAVSYPGFATDLDRLTRTR